MKTALLALLAIALALPGCHRPEPLLRLAAIAALGAAGAAARFRDPPPRGWDEPTLVCPEPQPPRDAASFGSCEPAPAPRGERCVRQLPNRHHTDGCCAFFCLDHCTYHLPATAER